MSTPEQDRQEYCKERMRPEIGREGEIGIKRRGTDALLEPRQIRRLVADQREDFLSCPVSPCWESVLV